MSGAPAVTAVDYHTAGEPFRIVTEGVPLNHLVGRQFRLTGGA